MPSIEFANTVEAIECFDWEFSQKDPIRDLTRAGALILAELERRLRAKEKEKMSENIVELPRWQSHKVVTAAKIILVDMAGREDGPEGTIMLKVIAANGQEIVLDVESEVFSRGVPEVGDYYVQYDGGYESWSPAEAFEKGYTRLP